MPNRFLNRRQLITLLGASAVGALGSYYLGSCNARQGSTPTENLLQGAAHQSSKDGLLDVLLEAQQAPVELAGRQAQLMAFNGQVPGPRLEVQPGDQVRIRFANRLGEPTNLHYHGLHVSPSGKADNVFVTVGDGDHFDYAFKIPEDHPAGMFWYHPHKHGRVARQVSAGLAGLLVVRGELDRIPEIQAAREEFLVLQDFALDDSNNLQKPSRMERRMQGREGNLQTVNGQLQPEFSIKQGELIRLRLLNASPSLFYRLQLEGHPLYLIATDAGAIERPVELQELLLTPGERAEVLVRGDRESGEYRLRNLPYERTQMNMRDGMDMGNGGMMNDGGMMDDGGMMGNSGSEAPMTLAQLSYRGQTERQPLPLSAAARRPSTLPQKLASIPTLPEPQKVRRFELGHSMARGRGMVFEINNRPFKAQRIDTEVPLDTVEEWEIANVGMRMMGFDHPFHLHTNPFQVMSRNGKAPTYRAWQDTVLVPANETIRIRIPFRDFAGKAVYHCHILDHEDAGMMGTVRMYD